MEKPYTIDEIKEKIRVADVLNEKSIHMVNLKRKVKSLQDDINYYKENAIDCEKRRTQYIDRAKRCFIKNKELISNMFDSLEAKSEEHINKFFEEEAEIYTHIRNIGNDLQSAKQSHEASRRYWVSIQESEEKLKEVEERISLLTGEIDDSNWIENLSLNIDKIQSHKRVRDIEITRDYLFVKTDEIFADFEFEGKMYKADIGQFDIRLPYFKMSNGDIRFHNLTNCRRNYWGENGNHPHVDTNGGPCLGNSESLIVQFYLENDLYGVFVACMMFLQQADTQDVAGRRVTNWEVYDMNGEVAEVNFSTCHVCGGVIDYDEDNYVYCEDCGRDVHEDCSTYIDDYGRVCDTCRDENYIYCEECDEYHGVDYCQEVDGRWLCDSCVQDLINTGTLVTCVNCNEVHYENNARWDEVNEEYYCEDCFESRNDDRADV